MNLINLEAEMSAVGAGVLSGEAVETMKSIITAQDFASRELGRIWAALVSLSNARKPIELLSITTELRLKEDEKDHFTERILGAMEYTPSSSGCQFYAEVVRDTAWKRRKRDELQKWLSKLETSDAGELSSELAKIGSMSDLAAGPSLVRLSDVPVDSDDRGILTGYGPAVDALTGGIGYVAGQVSVISAETKGGKTAWMIGSFRHAASEGKRAVYATFADLTHPQLKRRLLKQECGVGGRSYNLEKLAIFEGCLRDVNDEFSDWSRACLYDARRRNRDIETFMSVMLAEHAREPIDIVFADYAQRIGTREISGGERIKQMEFVSGKLDELAGRLGCPIVVGSQVTKREGEFRVRYSAEVENDCGLLLRLEKTDRQAKVTCVLNRFGPGDVEISGVWSPERVRFERFGDMK